MRKLVGLGLLLFSYWSSWAQSIVIFGKVNDPQGAAVPFATVYINNTSHFTTTDTAGHFSLKVPSTLQKLELVASFVGYKPAKVILKNDLAPKKVSFTLEESTDLKEVVVKAKMDKFWRKKWRIFEEGIMGDSPYGNKCEIMNKGVVHLEYDEKTGKVSAYSNGPLIIENHALGYKITAEIDWFESDGKLTYLAANKYFDTLQVNKVKELKSHFRNRNSAYENSMRSFLMALLAKNTFETGFVVFTMPEVRTHFLGKISLGDTLQNRFFKQINPYSLVKTTEDSSIFSLQSINPILVLVKNTRNTNSPFIDFPHQFSQIELPAGSFSFNKNGWIVQPNRMLIHNFWGADGFANLLPDDFSGNDTNKVPFKEDLEQLKTTGHKELKPQMPK